MPITLANYVEPGELVVHYVDLGGALGRAHARDKPLTWWRQH